jgi:hypothetical protein
MHEDEMTVPIVLSSVERLHLFSVRRDRLHASC